MEKKTRGKKPVQTPILNSLIVQGLVQWEANAHQYLGKAADGVWVNLGWNAISAERYLTTHPLPEQW